MKPQIACLFALSALPLSGMERIVVSGDGRGFVTEESKKPFQPWGLNYGNAGRLMEDFWDEDWETFAEDFRKMKVLGANVVRVHLQFGKFMRAADKPDEAALKQLARMLHLAEETGIYLDITGLACYRPEDTPAWYDAMDEKARWDAQATFWSAVADTCAKSAAVFCYDLANEVISPAGRREAGKWRSGSLLGGYDFLQYIALDPAGRKREDIARAWIEKLTTAIRKRDRNHLITVGLLPWSREWKHLSGFLPETVAPALDFISVHIYPDSKKPDEAMECLRKFDVGKPVVIEETFPLSCTAVELEKFLRESRAVACGWIGHFDGQSIEEADALEKAGKLSPHDAAYREWSRLFARLRPEFTR